MAVSTRRETGSQQFARLLQSYGVSHAFFVPTFFLPGLAEMDRIGITPISAHGEKAAAYMADGYARVSGKVGVCMAQTVGAANLAAGLKDAYMASAPVLALTGGPYVEYRFRHVYQEVSDYDSFRPVTKWQASVEDVGRLAELARQAFRAATTGTPGPVHLEVRGHMGQAAEPELDQPLVVEPRFGSLPPFRPVAEEESLAEAAKMLAGAERPVIVAGGGVISSKAGPELVALAERLSIPIATSMNGKAALVEQHPLNVGVCGFYSRESANRVVGEADLVFFVGSQTGSMVTTNWQVPKPGTAVIQLDLNPEELGRHYPCQVALQGDARASLSRLGELAPRRQNPTWIAWAQERVKEWRAAVQDQVTSEKSPIRPERMCAEISAVLPSDGAVVVDTLQSSIWAASMLALRSPDQRFVRCAGSLGWGLPASVGAKCAMGERAVIGFVGDGAAYYHLAELETAARHKVAAVVVVNNNASYAGEQQFWPAAYGADRAERALPNWTFPGTDFAQQARDMGCLGIRVEEVKDLRPALEQALASGRPAVIDVVGDPAALHPKGWTPA